MSNKETQFKKGNIPWNKGKKYPAMVGNKNAFKGDKRSDEQYRYEARNLLKHIKKCSVCNKIKESKQLVAHHVDENIKNNNISNLQKMCRSCHMNHHRNKIFKIKMKKYAKRKKQINLS